MMTVRQPEVTTAAPPLIRGEHGSKKAAATTTSVCVYAQLQSQEGMHKQTVVYALHPTIAAPTKKSTVEHVPTTFDLMPVMMYVDTKLRI